MDLNKALNESLDGMWNNRQYGGTSEMPRKDYQPYSSSAGYTFPYQSGATSVFPPTAPDPQNTPSIPWPLNTVDHDLSDSFVYLVSAVKKMERCIKENPSLNDKQRSAIKSLMKLADESLKRIEVIGANIVKVANLAGALPPQSPVTDERK
jgi:hypothetical protein